MLKQRVITAVLLAVVVIGSIVYGDTQLVSLLFALVLFAATRELLALTLKPALPFALMVSGAFSLLFWWSLQLVNAELIYAQSVAASVLWLLIGLAMMFYRHSGQWRLPVRAFMFLLGLDLLWVCSHGLVFLHQNYGWQALLFLFTLVWFADIGAYFSGKRFGHNKLAPRISPGKTWEGVLGGFALNLLWICLIYLLFEGLPLALLPLLLVGLATSMVSVVGDLFESILKREAGVKDSGKLLPGHGGVLDRIDSIIAASPVFLAGLLLMAAA